MLRIFTTIVLINRNQFRYLIVLTADYTSSFELLKVLKSIISLQLWSNRIGGSIAML